ncbi:PAS domain-containing protein [Methylomonas sp. LL1]|uniref:sensor histidine kinase n=1 Tax=Methylomonas sp. LL1 TaxID=2785785 RepID=UPI0018C3AB02|nr:ATP-binding protein [Methylomonas sp. LL1]QPK63018.1 PAS domain-containing protein [Methylomonas sp. LL1]
MPPNQADTIYPCPFSKGYGIPTRQAWLLLKIFFIYRFISASLFVMLAFLRFGASSLGTYNAQLYQVTSLAYLAISLLSVPFIFRRWLGYTHLAQLFIFTDIVFITLLMHASGGVGSGVGGLLAISIAAGGLLVGGRCALLFAALASLAVLAEEIFALETHAFDLASLNYSGLLGITFFAIALISVILAQRVEQSASLARRHAQTIIRLEELNRYIIQHLQSGIMIVDAQQFIVLSNQSALRLLGIKQSPTHLADVSALLQQAFLLWNQSPEQDFAIIQLQNGEEIQVRFSLLMVGSERLHMLLFEDIGLYNQRLQQSKLASLGRLTASIAHEIRNPLSAISHAGQLLSESPELKPGDLRLTNIIQTHCQRVNNIIEDILKLSRRNPSQKQRISLDQWLPVFIQEQNLHAAEQSRIFELVFKQQGLNAYADPGHLKQILDNLCVNALKYGKPELGRIVIEADRIQDEPCVRVIDNGPGIDQEGLLHLFEPFFTTSRQGTGLGLYISRELAELNQAQLIYAKYQGKTCFTLSLANADNVVIEI